jgi:GT2 family glycosyltransferase
VSEPVRISVVIPTYQRCASVRRALEALTRQTMPAAEYEVIVPIDGSDDGTREMIAGFRAPYRLTADWHPNQGRAAARNAGISLAQGQLIIFLDDDMEPVPGFLLAHWEAHPQGSRRAVVGPVPIPVDASSPPIVHYRQSGMNAHLDRLAQPGYKLGFRDIYTGNLSLPRELLREVGGFDETFKLYGHEDYELALRLVKAGVELGYCPAATAYQAYDKDFAALAQDCMAKGRTAVLFARMHSDVASSPQLATYRAGPWKWRATRAPLLLLSRWFPTFPERLIGSMTRLERRRPRRLHTYYRLAFDYFFWVGVQSALREQQRPDVRRIRTGLAVLVLIALASNLRVLIRELHHFAEIAPPDEITRYEDRFRELRRSLPPQGRVGYVTDAVPAESVAGADAARLAFKHYVLTQYALLPTLVLPDVPGALTVGNFDTAGGLDPEVTRGRTLVRDFGNGVVLFRTTAE